MHTVKYKRTARKSFYHNTGLPFLPAHIRPDTSVPREVNLSDIAGLSENRTLYLPISTAKYDTILGAIVWNVHKAYPCNTWYGVHRSKYRREKSLHQTNIMLLKIL